VGSEAVVKQNLVGAIPDTMSDAGMKAVVEEAVCLEKKVYYKIISGM
jgi:hypothetical protein